MMDNNLTLSREQVGEILKALNGIGNLVTNVASKPGNAFELYAIRSNIAAIRANLTRMSPPARPSLPGPILAGF